MSKPIIGIIGRKDKIVSKINREGSIVLYDYMKPLDLEGASYIGLITNEKYDSIPEDILALCDGFIMTGGVEIKDYHIEIIKYAIKNKIPFLGICQGSQALGLSTLVGAKLLKLDEMPSVLNHGFDITSIDQLHKPMHKVNLKEGSILYNLFGSEIDVNSNHHYALPMVSDPMEVVGTASDGVIEAIEHKDKNIFIVGVQCHPEDMESMQPLFKEFVKKAMERSK